MYVVKSECSMINIDQRLKAKCPDWVSHRWHMAFWDLWSPDMTPYVTPDAIWMIILSLRHSIVYVTIGNLILCKSYMAVMSKICLKWLILGDFWRFFYLLSPFTTQCLYLCSQKCFVAVFIDRSERNWCGTICHILCSLILNPLICDNLIPWQVVWKLVYPMWKMV